MAENTQISGRSEYTALFEIIYKYAVTIDSTYSHNIGNIMRKVMEAYGTFVYKKGMSELSTNEQILAGLNTNDKKYFENLMYRLVLNTGSHMQEKVCTIEDMKFFDFISDSDKQRTARDIICFLYKLNPLHVLAHLKECENENTQLTKSILKLQNYDEIHIEIDLLSQSPQGIDILEKKYAVLQGQLAIQKQIRAEYEEQYKTMEPIMSKLNIYKNRLSVMKAANTELLFNHKRHKDMLPLITTYQEKIKNNDNLIQNYKNNITDIIAIRNQNSELSIEEIAKRIEIFDKERKKLEEKKMQLNLYIDVYFKQGNETKRDKTYAELTEPFYRIVGNDPTMNKIINDSEEKLMEMNKQRIDELEKEAKMLSKQITDFDENEKNQKEQGIVINPLMIKTRNDLKDKIEMEENKVKYLLEEIEKNQNAFLDAKEVLKDKIAYFDDMIERELKYARIRKYEEESKLHGMDYY
jgi:hypothetical protein